MPTKTDHTKYRDAKALVEYLSKLEANDEGAAALHHIDRCKWCQDNLNSWLLVKIWHELKGLEKRLKAKGVIE